MRFHFLTSPTLPRLSWCARIDRGQETVRVRCGNWVETTEDSFSEAAWDGEFSRSQPDLALTMTGTAARLSQESITFATSTNLHDRLYFYPEKDSLWVSNSLAFVLVEADDEPDLDFPYYTGEWLSQLMAGIQRENRSLPMKRGEVILHECANLTVGPDLEITRHEKPTPPEPRNYDEYFELLSQTINGVLKNARSPGRARPYSPLGTISRGYDAPAIVSLARSEGCREAATFVDETDDPLLVDNGSLVGEKLELRVLEFERNAYKATTGIPEAEFCVTPPASDIQIASMEPILPGRILLTGRYGDDILSLGERYSSLNLAQEGQAGMSGSLMNEFRLRVGFQQFPPLFTGWQHLRAVQQLGRSSEMKPWSIGGDYDRPLARRILEEAGVPRSYFGSHKMGGAHLNLTGARDLCPTSQADFKDFLADVDLSGTNHISARVLYRLHRLTRWINRNSVRMTRFTGRPLRPAPRLNPRYWPIPATTPLFHWGFQRTRDRYR